MSAYECAVCSYVYGENSEGIAWDDLADDWVCPVCGAEKEFFEPADAAVEPQGTAPTAKGSDLGSYLGPLVAEFTVPDPAAGDYFPHLAVEV